MHTDTPPTPQAATDSGRTLLTVEAAAAQLSIGRTTMYALIKAYAIDSVLIGRLRRVPASALTEYITRLANKQHTNNAA